MTRVWAVVWVAAVLAGCGYVGNPLPPALDIPAKITDLRAIEYGDKIAVEFTVPALTTEGLDLKSVESVELRAGPGGNPFNLGAWAGAAKSYDLMATAPGALRKEISAQEWIGKEIVVGVRAVGPKGKPSDWSNVVSLRVDPPLARPAGLRAENVDRGVALAWTGTAPRYRVFRSEGSQPPARLNEADRPEYVDESSQYGTTYKYFVQALAGDSQQSEVAESAPITPVDVFPPAVPATVTAVAGVGAIELAWERNTEADFKGYNIYRSVDDGPFQNIASLIDAPTYSDRDVQTGKRYRYAITAVDQIGNESQRSAVADVVAQ